MEASYMPYMIPLGMKKEQYIDSQTGIKVTLYTPEKLNKRVQQQKINHIYDILKPKTCDR